MTAHITLLVAALIGPAMAPADEARALIPRLGSPRCAEREAAQRRLETLCHQDGRVVPVVATGLGGPDPEVRRRCYRIICHVRPCNTCHGLGWRCTRYGGARDESDYEPCPACKATGSYWLRNLLSDRGPIR